MQTGSGGMHSKNFFFTLNVTAIVQYMYIEMALASEKVTSVWSGILRKDLGIPVLSPD